MYLKYMYEQNLALNNLQGLIGHKTLTNCSKKKKKNGRLYNSSLELMFA